MGGERNGSLEMVNMDNPTGPNVTRCSKMLEERFWASLIRLWFTQLELLVNLCVALVFQAMTFAKRKCIGTKNNAGCTILWMTLRTSMLVTHVLIDLTIF